MIDVKPSGPDRMVPVPGKERVYFPQDVWTSTQDIYELRRLIAADILPELVKRAKAGAIKPDLVTDHSEAISEFVR